MNERLATQLESLSTDPGIYKYFDQENELIYVGKAVNLRNRVKSYFIGKDHSPKTQILVSRIDRLETLVVQSEMDALILEANLIKEFRPRYNIILKDDKSHLYIKISLYEDFPRVSTCRQTDMHFDPKATYFGPYPSGGTVKQTLRFFRRIFPYVARHQPQQTGRRRPPQSYFYYNLPLGPVDSVIDKKLYRKQIFEMVHFLEGKRLQVAADLEKDMKQAAKVLDFEQAAAIKQQLDGLTYISQRTITPESYLANPELMAEKREKGLLELVEVLKPYFHHFDQSPAVEVSPIIHRIECFDISNISGQQAVGSMVVFEDGEAKKSDYRKFRIKRENTPNDFAMLQEVLRRRFARLQTSTSDSDIGNEMTEGSELESKGSQSKQRPDDSFSSIPDLIVVDGGKGQLSAALLVLDELNLTIPLVGMTKREEELVIQRSDNISQLNTTIPTVEPASELKSQPTVFTSQSKPKRSSAHGSLAFTEEDTTTQTTTEANFITIRLARGSEALFLIQRLRDEAHRFAITYHRKLRSKDFLPKK